MSGIQTWLIVAGVWPVGGKTTHQRQPLAPRRSIASALHRPQALRHHRVYTSAAFRAIPHYSTHGKTTLRLPAWRMTGRHALGTPVQGGLHGAGRACWGRGLFLPGRSPRPPTYPTWARLGGRRTWRMCGGGTMGVGQLDGSRMGGQGGKRHAPRKRGGQQKNRDIKSAGERVAGILQLRARKDTWLFWTACDFRRPLGWRTAELTPDQPLLQLYRHGASRCDTAGSQAPVSRILTHIGPGAALRGQDSSPPMRQEGLRVGIACLL